MVANKKTTDNTKKINKLIKYIVKVMKFRFIKEEKAQKPSHPTQVMDVGDKRVIVNFPTHMNTQQWVVVDVSEIKQNISEGTIDNVTMKFRNVIDLNLLESIDEIRSYGDFPIEVQMLGSDGGVLLRHKLRVRAASINVEQMDHSVDGTGEMEIDFYVIDLITTIG